VANEATRVRVECAGRIALFQELWPGQTKILRCEEPVVLSADNAGAIACFIDDRPAVRLGGAGERIEGAVVAPAPADPVPRRVP
jgi:hypothetical protein